MKAGKSTTTSALPLLGGAGGPVDRDHQEDGPRSQAMVDLPIPPRVVPAAHVQATAPVERPLVFHVVEPTRDEVLEQLGEMLQFLNYDPPLVDAILHSSRGHLGPEAALNLARECMLRAERDVAEPGGGTSRHYLLEVAARLLDRLEHRVAAPLQHDLTKIYIAGVASAQTYCLSSAIALIQKAPDQERPQLEQSLVNALEKFFGSRGASGGAFGLRESALFEGNVASLHWVVQQAAAAPRSFFFMRALNSAIFVWQRAIDLAKQHEIITTYVDAAARKPDAGALLCDAIQGLFLTLKATRPGWNQCNYEFARTSGISTDEQWYAIAEPLLDRAFYCLQKIRSSERLGEAIQIFSRGLGAGPVPISLQMKYAEALLDFPLDERSRAALMKIATLRGISSVESARSAAISSFHLDPLGQAIDPSTQATYSYPPMVQQCRAILAEHFSWQAATLGIAAAINGATNLPRDVSVLIAQMDGERLRGTMHQALQDHNVPAEPR